MSRWFSARELAVACGSVLIVVLAGITIRQASGSTSPVMAAWTVGGDFAAFYLAGRILNDHQGARLYDLDLQEQTYRELVPDAPGLSLPFLYPPFVGALFRPLAHLPLSTALVVFLVAMPAIFLAAVRLLLARFGPVRTDQRIFAMAAALSFFPFVGYTWLGAQISTVGFTSMAVALVAEDSGRPFLSGLALSVLLYKPTLLVLIGPMLIVGRQFRQLAGLVVGSALVAVVCVAIAGVGSTVAALNTMTSTARSVTGANSPFMVPYRYVDLNAFSTLLPGGRTIWGFLAIGVIALAGIVFLAMAWAGYRKAGRPERLLIWAATLVCTLVLNVRTPAYDSILVVAAALMAIEAVRQRDWRGWNSLSLALLCVYVAPWVSELSARTTKVQVYTISLGWLGALLLYEARSAHRAVAAMASGLRR